MGGEGWRNKPLESKTKTPKLATPAHKGTQTPLTFREERKCASVQESPPPPQQQRRTHYVNNSQLQHLQHSGNNNEQQPTPRWVIIVVIVVVVCLGFEGIF